MFTGHHPWPWWGEAGGGGSNKSPRTAATVPAQAEVPDALPVTETDGDGFGVVA